MRNYTRVRRPYKFLFLCLVLGFCYTNALSQGATNTTKGYGKASYTIAQAAKFMKTWLVAGPISVSEGSAEPEAALQQANFKTDLFAHVPVNANSPVGAISIKSKVVKWQIINSTGDIVDLDSFYQRKDYAYAYALAEIKA